MKITSKWSTCEQVSLPRRHLCSGVEIGMKFNKCFKQESWTDFILHLIGMITVIPWCISSLMWCLCSYRHKNWSLFFRGQTIMVLSNNNILTEHSLRFKMGSKDRQKVSLTSLIVGLSFRNHSYWCLSLFPSEHETVTGNISLNFLNGQRAEMKITKKL